MRRALALTALATAVVLVASLAGCSSPSVPDATASTSGSASGDRRSVSEPVTPTTTCATVTAQLTLADGLGPDADESAPPDTARLQQALDGCAQKDASVVAVRLSASGSFSDFLSGPLIVRAGEMLVLDSGVTLFASRNPSDYQVGGRATCGTIGGAGDGCVAFLTIGGSHAGVASSPDANGAQGRIDGRGGASMVGMTSSWWQLSAAAKSGGAQNVPRLIQTHGVDDITLHDVDLVDSPGFHVSFQNGDGLTVWGVRIRTPATARNTDGIDPAGATDVTIAQSWIMDGDDGIAIKAQSAPSAHITIVGDHFLGTHGISIGSETTAGVSDVLVADDTISGTDADGNASVSSAAIRIKSSSKAGGVVRRVLYRNVGADAVKAPIDIDPAYAGGKGSNIPWFTDIRIDGFRADHSPAGATSTMQGMDAAHPLGLTLVGVAVDAAATDMASANITATDATFGGAPLASSGAGVTVTAGTGTADAPRCTFPSYPAL